VNNFTSTLSAQNRRNPTTFYADKTAKKHIISTLSVLIDDDFQRDKHRSAISTKSTKAQNALTSVNQLERFYLSHAESKMKIENLQSFA
jgi:hypothetical protein